jgi:ArsR family transcriptional regulator
MATNDKARKASAKELANKLQAIAEPTRILILEVIAEGRIHVSDLAKRIGVEIVNVSHHLGVLSAANLVESEKQGRFVFYKLGAGMAKREGGGFTFTANGLHLTKS